jgi:hypothetical protein
MELSDAVLRTPRLPFVTTSDIPTSDLRMFAPQFLTDKTKRVLDFGYCLLRMNVGVGAANS